MALESEPRALKIDLVTGEVVVPLEWVTGIAAVVQGVRTRMLLVRGEWFLDLDVGVPYFEREGVDASEALIGQKFVRSRAIAAFRDAILRTPDVTEVLRLEVDLDATRSLSVTWQARTAFGDTPVDVLATGES